MDGIDETLAERYVYELLVWDELETDIGSLEEFSQEF